MSEPRDFAREIGQASANGDVATLTALCVELAPYYTKCREMEALGAARKLRQAEKKRRQRDSVPFSPRDIPGQEGTIGDSPFPLVPPSPLPTPNLSTPFNPPSPKLARSRNVTAYTADFEAFWESYPREARVEKQKAFKAWGTRLREGFTAEVIAGGLERYKRHLAASGRYAKNPATFVGPDHHFLETWELAAIRDPGETAAQRSESEEGARKALIGKVQARKQQPDGDAWWAGVEREAAASSRKPWLVAMELLKQTEAA